MSDRMTKHELLVVICEWMLPVSMIILNCCKMYDFLSDVDFVHLCFNHSMTFKDPDTGTYKNTSESIWLAMKHFFRYNTNHVKGEFLPYLRQYMW